MKDKYAIKNRLNNKDLLKYGAEGKRVKRLKMSCFVSAAILVFNTAMHLAPQRCYTNSEVTPYSTYTIAHGGGSLRNDKGITKKYLNCVDSFYAYYEDGTRMFEYDLVFSKDGKLIGTHQYEYLKGYSLENPISYEYYVNTKIAGKYRGMTDDILFDLIKNYPDCRFLIDTKEEDHYAIYKHLIDKAEQENVDISHAIIPFISSKEMLNLLDNRYDFEEYMFTNYKEYYNTQELIDIIDSNDKIKFLHVFPIDLFRVDLGEINKKGIRVFAHMDKANIFLIPLAYGCSGIFTDDITEDYFKEHYEDYLLNKFPDVETPEPLIIRKEQEERLIKRQGQEENLIKRLYENALEI